MKKLNKFVDIGRFRNVIKEVTDRTRYVGKTETGEPIFDDNITLPILKFKGTVKLHGTNAGISLSNEGEYFAQSKDNIITIQNDNHGFAFYAESNKEVFMKMFDRIKKQGFGISDMEMLHSFNDHVSTITIFGEWIGQGIQKGVAIAQLPKSFVIFGVKLAFSNPEIPSVYLPDFPWSELQDESIRCYNIQQYKTFSIDIDFNHPEIAQEQIEKWVLEVENECPFGKKMGVSGIGEGIVFSYFNEDGSMIRFKAKGEKHSVSKTKSSAPIDVEKMNSVSQFVDYSVTENRLNQGMERVFTDVGETIDIKKLGDFLKWIVNDIIKEEMDTMNESDLTPKDVNPAISKVAREWFLKKWNTI